MRHSADMRSKQPNKVAIRQIDEGRLVRGLLSFRVIALLRMSAIGPKRTSVESGGYSPSQQSLNSPMNQKSVDFRALR